MEKDRRKMREIKQGLEFVDGIFKPGKIILNTTTEHYFLFGIVLFSFFISLFKTRFLCIMALAVLELALLDHACLEFKEILLPLPPKYCD